MEEVITEPYVTIKVDKANLSLMSDWMGSPTTEQFKNGKGKMLDILVDYSLSVVVLNYHNMVAYLNLETQVWAINEWFPKVMKENIKRVGVVIPSKVMAQIVVKSICSGLSNAASSKGIEISYFDTVDQMQEWVRGDKSVGTVAQPSHQPGHRVEQPASIAKKKHSTDGGVDLGGGQHTPATPDYSQMDDEIHDDPFA